MWFQIYNTHRNVIFSVSPPSRRSTGSPFPMQFGRIPFWCGSGAPLSGAAQAHCPHTDYHTIYGSFSANTPPGTGGLFCFLCTTDKIAGFAIFVGSTRLRSSPPYRYIRHFCLSYRVAAPQASPSLPTYSSFLPFLSGPRCSGEPFPTDIFDIFAFFIGSSLLRRALPYRYIHRFCLSYRVAAPQASPSLPIYSSFLPFLSGPRCSSEPFPTDIFDIYPFLIGSSELRSSLPYRYIRRFCPFYRVIAAQASPSLPIYSSFLPFLSGPRCSGKPFPTDIFVVFAIFIGSPLLKRALPYRYIRHFCLSYRILAARTPSLSLFGTMKSMNAAHRQHSPYRRDAAKINQGCKDTKSQGGQPRYLNCMCPSENPENPKTLESPKPKKPKPKNQKIQLPFYICVAHDRIIQIGIYGDVSRLSGQRYRFSGTGAFLGKEGSFECLRVKSGMKLVFCKKRY